MTETLVKILEGYSPNKIVDEVSKLRVGRIGSKRAHHNTGFYWSKNGSKTR